MAMILIIQENCGNKANHEFQIKAIHHGNQVNQENQG
jgi:hypothetical protein